jgi:cellulose synthase/poly-beta-1,6-N-acetylglucosamine synthase-like glycosyltransferase
MSVLSVVYIGCAFLLAASTFSQWGLLIQYLRYRRRTIPQPLLTRTPSVTVQLPLYNEQHVVARLLNAVTSLDYPQDRLHIQILDDSTDETPLLVAHHVALLKQHGYHISHLQRHDRIGYKAGALTAGLEQTNSEFVLILDADFVPAPDFLQRTLPYLLHDDTLGVVQTRWAHLNSNDNWLTRAQRLAIDAHFVIEQTARNRAGWLVPFNGTGGIWRVSCIEEAGGWEARTLTEDLDLSYRAQLKGWKSLYLPDVAVPGELPPQMMAYRRQQARWAVGSTQCLMHLGGPVWRSQRSLSSRVMALLHLAQYLPHPLMLMLLLLTPPLLLTRQLASLPLAPLGLVGLIPPLMYVISQRVLYPRSWVQHLLAFPALMLFTTGLSWSNTRAVGQALWQETVPFERTPKFGNGWKTSRYALRQGSILRMETFLCFYALWGAILAWHTASQAVPYLLLYAASFAAVVVQEWWEAQQVSPKTEPVEALSLPKAVSASEEMMTF